MISHTDGRRAAVNVVIILQHPVQLFPENMGIVIAEEWREYWLLDLALSISYPSVFASEWMCILFEFFTFTTSLLGNED
jgi:hypothetical protein